MKILIDIGMFLTGEQFAEEINEIDFTKYIEHVPTLGEAFDVGDILRIIIGDTPLYDKFEEEIRENNDVGPLYVREIDNSFEKITYTPHDFKIEQIITLRLGHMEDGIYDKLYSGE